MRHASLFSKSKSNDFFRKTLQIALFFLAHFVTAQTTLNFRLNDCDTKEPIAYAHIGIAEKSVGTISNEQGLVSLNIPVKNVNDTLTISFIGYETKSVPIKKIKSSLELCPDNVLLNEIVIRPKKEKILGRKNGRGNSTYMFQGIGSGGEIAAKISNNKSIVIRKVGVYLECNNCDTLSFFITIYKGNKNKIGEIINTKPYIVKVKSIKEGWVDYELPQVVSVKDDFFVGLEIIQASNECEVQLQGNYQFVKSDKSYIRKNSHDKWLLGNIDFPIRAIVNYD
jgi:hypothetical protein